MMRTKASDIIRVDCHSHILPGIDDGAKDVNESVQLLNLLHADNIDYVIASPHLYLQNDDINTFIKKRKASYDDLLSHINRDCSPQIILSAEVYFSPALIGMDLKPLCTENTNCLLLELPYQFFTSTTLTQIADLINYCASLGITVILAHIERYIDFSDYETMKKIIEIGALAQLNCGSIIDKKRRKLALSLITDGIVQFLGTDTHSVKMRSPNFKEAEHIIRKRLHNRYFNTLISNAVQLINGKIGV